MLNGKGSKYATRYDRISELKEDRGETKINGINIDTGLKIGSSSGHHHGVIVIEPDSEYGYENILITALGARRTIHFINENEISYKVSGRNIHPIRSDKFIVIDSDIYHIPTGQSIPFNQNPRNLVERIPNVLDVIGKDIQIQWKNGSLEKYNNITSEDVKDEDNIESDEIGSEQIESKVESSSKMTSYKEILESLVDSTYYIKTLDEAEGHLNGELEITDKQRVKREFESIKKMYVNGRIDIDGFEKRMNDFFNKNEEYIYVTGEKSDTQLSEFDTDVTDENTNKTTDEEDQMSAFNW